jgi:hypothetical protein
MTNHEYDENHFLLLVLEKSLFRYRRRKRRHKLDQQALLSIKYFIGKNVSDEEQNICIDYHRSLGEY